MFTTITMMGSMVVSSHSSRPNLPDEPVSDCAVPPYAVYPWQPWYDLAGDPSINAVVVEARRTLALRFHATGRYLRLFVARAFPPSGVWSSDCQHRRAHGAWPERYFAPGVAPMKGSGPVLPV